MTSYLVKNPWAAALTVGLAYFAAALAGAALSAPNAFATLWPPNGVIVAALVLAPRRLWPLLLLATCPANLAFDAIGGRPMLVSLAYWMVNAGESCVVAAALVRFDIGRFRRQNAHAHAVAVFAGCSIVGTALGGLAGASATLLRYPPDRFLKFWLSWWMADLLGIVVATPLLVTTILWFHRGRRPTREIVVYAAALVAVSIATVLLLLLGADKGFLFQPLLIPLLGWSALRFGIPGTAWAVLVSTVLTILSSMYSRGDVLLPNGFTVERAMMFQAVLSGLSLTFLGIAGAIEDRRQSEGAYRRREASRREYVATMTHEIRNPLGVILGAVQMIDDEGDGSDQRRFQPVRAIERAARQILDLAEQLLASGRAETTYDEVTVDTFWLPALWKTLGEDCAHLVGRRPVELRWKSPAPDISLLTDRWRVEVVVRNLVMNALKFTERGHVAVECSAADASVTIVVRDTGIGISALDQERIFRLYERGTNAQITRHGSGIGLFTVLGFVTELGGTVSLTSEIGTGTEFRVTLPQVIRAATPASRATVA